MEKTNEDIRIDVLRKKLFALYKEDPKDHVSIDEVANEIASIQEEQYAIRKE